MGIDRASCQTYCSNIVDEVKSIELIHSLSQSVLYKPKAPVSRSLTLSDPFPSSELRYERIQNEYKSAYEHLNNTLSQIFSQKLNDAGSEASDL